MHSAWIGFDPHETSAYAVARRSLRKAGQFGQGVVLSQLMRDGLYYRPTQKRLGKLWDVISKAPMSTEFAISRFLVPHLAKRGWAMFTDCDVLFRHQMVDVFNNLDTAKAVYCVKHDHVPDRDVKMNGHEQTAYPRKNWSSVMIFNCDHPANKALTVELVNTVPGRDLHRFCWLEDELIGELPASMNYLVGHTKDVPDPSIVHFTDGGPWFQGFENVEYADEWRAQLENWAI